MEILIGAVNKLSTGIRSTLEKARNSRDLNKEAFFSKDYVILGKAISLYANCFKSLGIKANKEFKNVIGKSYSAPAVRDAVEKLENVEEEWVEFLDENEKMLERINKATTLIKIGDNINLNHQLMDARSEK